MDIHRLSPLLVSALILCGCSGEKQAAQEEVPIQDALPSEATVLLDAATAGAWPSGLDPATNATGALNLSLMNAIFGGLFQLTADADGANPQIVGVLAEGYEIAEAGRSLIIHLREDLSFSDGTPLDAEAVRFNVERNLETACSCAPTRWPWHLEEPARVVDEHTVVLQFTRPYPAAINGLPVMNINWVASPDALESLGEEAFRITPVGAGPFRVVSNQPGNRLVLERNPGYWQAGRPYLDRLTFQSIGSEQAAYLALLTGDAQVYEGMVNTALIDQARQHAAITVTEQPPTGAYVIQLNTLTEPLDDIRVRRAIYHATDPEAIANGLFVGRYPVSQSFTGPGGLFHQAQVAGYPGHDLQAARALVEDVGGIRIRLGTLHSPIAEQLVTALQSQWQAAGMDVSLELFDISQLISQLSDRDWQALVQVVGSYDPEAGSGVDLRFGSGRFFSGVTDTRLDRLLLEAASAVDDQRRDALYAQVSHYLGEQAYAPFLVSFSPVQLSTGGLEGPGLTTAIPPISVNTAILWQDVRFVSR